SWFGDRIRKALSPWLKWEPQPSDVRWIIFFLWALLSVNNMFNLNYQVGTDGWGHIEYIDYIAIKGTLPLAPEGWHMFQPPLNYLLSAPLYAVLIKCLDLPSVVKIMTIVPILCGLMQIEIVYRAAKLVFTDRKDLQIIAIITGSFLPIHTYACQYVGNEPLTACLVSLVILLCLFLIVPEQEQRGYGYFILIGLIWGLALLSKITAMLLAPVLIMVIIFHAGSVKKPLRSAWRPVITVFFVAMIVAGWYYLRNYIKLGNAFMGLFDPLTMLQWWQDPGYRMWPHLWSFGEALHKPVYAGLTSFWDMFYATLWLDGINSGLVDFIPWNRNFMIAGTLLALVPSVFIVTGVIFQALNNDAKQKRAVILSVILILLFLAAMIDMYIVCPLYSRTKASYTLGLLPCYAILIAAGAEPFLRNRIIRAIALGLFACWAFAAYAAYFVPGFQ
ncbi:MAG TPA: glycosyltransferase family 39 protein, partial [Flexilinea sp.]|nr:glycosyltransferase family 39 protein [Flexilinea sp.]